MSSTLSFRDKGISRAARRHIIYLTGVFIASLVFFFVVLNIRPATRTNTIEAGDIPIISMESQGYRLSEMHGYLTEMDGCYMRESLVPLGKKRDITVIISGSDAPIESAEYEIRSMDTERKIEEEQITDFQDKKGEKTAKLVLSNLVEEGEEYLLVITLETGGNQLRYYTRITCPTNTHIRDCLKFASFFNKTAMEGDATKLEGYLETDPNTNQNTLSRVTIHSSLSQISWKGFEGDMTGDPVVRFTEIGDDYAAITYNYQRSDTKDNLFNVEEYFKMRYTSERMYLLDYERTMEQIPNEEFQITENILNAGVTNDDFRYLSNDTGTVVAFVQAGELYEYNQNNQTARRIFGFRDKDLSDPHTNYNQHGIRILDIDENGAIDFVVYGYMNAGLREGYSGINLYHYDAGERISREQAFIALTRPYPVLEASFSELLYKSAGGAFYVMIDGTLTRIDSSTAMTRELLTGMVSGQYAVSMSGKYVAWMDQEEVSKEIHVMNLEDESRFDISADSDDEWIRPLEFLEENLAYGHVRKADTGQDAAGNKIYPCYRLDIRDISGSDGEILKVYQKDGYYVSSATSNSYTLFLERVIKNGSDYERTDNDTIQDSSGEPNRAVSLEYTQDDIYGELTSIVLVSKASLEEQVRVELMDTALAFASEAVITTLDVSDVHENYYVYVGNRVILSSTKVTSAIKSADKEMGIVVDNAQRNIWKRTKKSYVNPFSNMTPGTSDTGFGSLAEALSAILVREGENVEVHTLLDAGESPVYILQGALKDHVALDLTGATLDEVLYFVNYGSPVLVRLGSDDARLIIGYDASGVFIYDPDSGKTVKQGRSDASELFESNGNIFISYI